MGVLADTMDAIEQRFEDERALRRLAAAERDERLTADERRVAVDRAAFYIGDLHWRRRQAEQFARAELDVAEPRG